MTHYYLATKHTALRNIIIPSLKLNPFPNSNVVVFASYPGMLYWYIDFLDCDKFHISRYFVTRREDSVLYTRVSSSIKNFNPRELEQFIMRYKPTYKARWYHQI
jgi:hypothetical protein